MQWDATPRSTRSAGSLPPLERDTFQTSSRNSLFDAVVSADAYETPAWDDTRSSALAPNSPLLSREEASVLGLMTIEFSGELLASCC